MTNYNQVVRPDTELASETPTNAVKPILDIQPEPVQPKLEIKEDHGGSILKSGDQIARVLYPHHLNVRTLPDITSPVVTVIKHDNDLIIESIKDEWAHVYTADDLEGYVISEYLGPIRVV